MERGVVFVLVIVLLSVSVFAHELSLSLESEEIGNGQPVLGTVTIDFDGRVDLESNVEVYIDDDTNKKQPHVLFHIGRLLSFFPIFY